MSAALFGLWAIVGWCGTPYPWWWWRVPPPPDPEPWWSSRLIGVVAGIIGGWAFAQAFGPQPEPWTAVTAAATAVGAFSASRLVGDLYGRVRGGGSTTRG